MNMEDTMAFSIDKERYEYHYRKTKRKRVRLIIALILWLTVIVYLITPFSSYKMMHVKGNVYLSQDDVLELAGIKNTWWWLVDSNKLRDKLESYDALLDNVSVTKGVNGLNISILEKYPIAIKDNKYLMNYLKILNREEYPYTIENLIDISDLNEENTNVFGKQYIHVDLAIRELFYKGKMIDSKTIEMKGKFDENSHFAIQLNLDFISVKLSNNNFSKIKDEILGKVTSGNVKYSEETPCIVKYNFSDVYKWELN